MTIPKPYRLPTTVTPERYALRLTPDLDRWTFAGEETIAVQVYEPVSEIVLNAAELEIHAVSVKRGDGKVLRVQASLDEENELAKLSFPETLTQGPCYLRISFSGVLN